MIAVSTLAALIAGMMIGASVAVLIAGVLCAARRADDEAGRLWGGATDCRPIPTRPDLFDFDRAHAGALDMRGIEDRTPRVRRIQRDL
jgi:hypothetical protein